MDAGGGGRGLGQQGRPGSWVVGGMLGEGFLSCQGGKVNDRLQIRTRCEVSRRVRVGWETQLYLGQSALISKLPLLTRSSEGLVVGVDASSWGIFILYSNRRHGTYNASVFGHLVTGSSSVTTASHLFSDDPTPATPPPTSSPDALPTAPPPHPSPSAPTQPSPPPPPPPHP